MSERRAPPMNIVLEGQRCPSPPPIRFHNHYKNYNNNYYTKKNPSARSIVSSVTFSEIDESDYTESDVDVFDTAIFDDDDDDDDNGDGNNNNDHMPGMPQRRLSMNAENIKLVSSAAAAGSRRGAGAGAGDAAPCLPSRQQSVAGGSQKGGGGGGKLQQQQQHHQLSSQSDLNGSNSTLNSGKTSANSSTEPMPEYLQQDFGGVEEMIESKLRELSEKAERFKRVVDLRDRKYGLRTYKNCFVGKEACDRMMEAGLVTTRSEAVELGRSFVQHLGLFRHVTNDHNFNDRYLFYEFVLDNNDNDNQGKKNKKNNNNNSSSSIKKMAKNRWNSVPQPKTMMARNAGGGPWYSSSLVRSERDMTIVEGQPMSQQDLIADMTTKFGFSKS